MDNKTQINTYVEWANTLDSTGKDSTQARARLRGPALVPVARIMGDIIEVGKFADDIKKLVFYGKPVEVAQYSELSPERIGNAVSAFQSHDLVRIFHAALGFVTESAEIMEMLYKHIYEGEEFDWNNLTEECGDLLWYMALMAKAKDLKTFDEFMLTNRAKLTKRYGDTWTQDAALNRDIPAEQEVFEGDGVPWTDETTATPLEDLWALRNNINFTVQNEGTVGFDINNNRIEQVKININGETIFFYPESPQYDPNKVVKELAVEKFNTLDKIVSQLSACMYESKHSGGSLENNSAFIALREHARIQNLLIRRGDAPDFEDKET